MAFSSEPERLATREAEMRERNRPKPKPVPPPKPQKPPPSPLRPWNRYVYSEFRTETWIPRFLHEMSQGTLIRIAAKKLGIHRSLPYALMARRPSFGREVARRRALFKLSQEHGPGWANYCRYEETRILCSRYGLFYSAGYGLSLNESKGISFYCEEHL